MFRPYVFKVEMYQNETVYVDGADPLEVLERIFRCYDNEVRRITLVPKDMNEETRNLLLERA